MSRPEPAPAQRYGRYVGILGVLIVVLITINTTLTKPNGVGGHRTRPEAGAVRRAARAGRGERRRQHRHPRRRGRGGKRPACSVRGAGILNICELYEQGPVVLALFVDAGSCPRILSDLQALAPSFPGVRFAGVAIKGERASCARWCERGT